MHATLADTREQQLVELDEEVEGLKRRLDEAASSFGEALDEVGSRPDVDESLQGRLADVAQRLKDLQPRIQDLDFDVEQSAEMFSSMLEVDRAVHSDGDELDRFEQILLGVERVRQVIRDALDEFTGGRSADRQDLVRRLEEHLPGVSQEELAALAGVTARTWRRWAASSGQPSERLLLVAKLVQILHHAWSPKGIDAWFHRPRRQLDGRTPLDLLADPAAERALLAEARGSRNQYAT